MPRKKRQSYITNLKLPNKGLIFLVFILLSLGIIAVADTSSPQALSVFSDPYYFAKQQFQWAVIGLIGMFIASFIPYRIYKELAWPIFAVVVILLLVVLIPGVGSRLLGARRWIYIGGFGFQPSEIVKISLAILFARLASVKSPYWWYIGILAIVGILIMLQPDLGTLLVIITIGMVQLFASGMPLLYMGGMVGVGGILGILVIMFSDYRRERLMTFFEMSSDPLDTSYHIRQVLIAIGSGGIWGLGLGQSRQKHLFLPETATDSVFAIIAEETGFIGSLIVVGLLTIFILKAIKIAGNAPDTFGTMLAVGISAWIGGQMFLNLASMSALTPLTGIPLPFFSYGGTSLTTVLFAVGILLNISRHAKDK